MIFQNEDAWPPVGDRPRRWAFSHWGDTWLGRFGPTDLAPDEDLVEYPPTVAVSDTEWGDYHATLFGLEADGQTLADGYEQRDIRTPPS